VVLELDQTGHGYSDPPALANGFGGPDRLAYMRSLDIVDPDRIVLEGHSMGGWAGLIAAGVMPDDYSSVVVSGSSTGTYGAPDGTPTWPRNFGLVFWRYDEFSQLMWGAAVPADVGLRHRPARRARPPVRLHRRRYGAQAVPAARDVPG
jgi:pimeloyl-ACP methyl ester carboxylesterase